MCVHAHACARVRARTHTHTHTRILFSQKKNEIVPFAATWMDLDMIQSKEKDKHHMILLMIGILKNKTNELIYKTEIDL